MGLITLLRGFKVPIGVLDCFLVAHGVEETYSIAPRLEPGPLAPPLDPQSAFLRARLAAAGTASTSSPPSPAALDGVRVFIPNRRGQADPTYAYVSYAFVMVFSQRHVDLAAELPERAPPGFAALRRDVLACASKASEAAGLLHAAGMVGDAESELFVLFTEDREFPLKRPFVRESDLRCELCAGEFETWSALQVHRIEDHGVTVRNPLPDDL
ncbi:hypothetical protein N658DRAFT_333072 [Parathielavia hyrcaniae]|uniref:C2H2-type domain-containing protein n=1 Tax=Parathielavia hyrcaniae TaxID=113614 RepID=A0AAN6PRU3_9PEZI|nr:hypothetical protein N658DRAFT_333072 [Parathielavia hyrcaniae]